MEHGVANYRVSDLEEAIKVSYQVLRVTPGVNVRIHLGTDVFVLNAKDKENKMTLSLELLVNGIKGEAIGSIKLEKFIEEKTSSLESNSIPYETHVRTEGASDEKFYGSIKDYLADKEKKISLWERILHSYG